MYDKKNTSEVKIGYRAKMRLSDFEVCIGKSNPDGGVDMHKVVSNDFRERFAKSVAALIIAEWDSLVFDESYFPQENGEFECAAYMWLRKKNKHIEKK